MNRFLTLAAHLAVGALLVACSGVNVKEELEAATKDLTQFYIEQTKLMRDGKFDQQKFEAARDKLDSRWIAATEKIKDPATDEPPTPVKDALKSAKGEFMKLHSEWKDKRAAAPAGS